MSFETNLQTLFSELREAIAVSDLDGKVVFRNDAWQALPDSLKQLAEQKLSANQPGEYLCQETASSVSIMLLGRFVVAIIHREEQQLIIKDRILNQLLESLAKHESVFDAAAQAMGRFMNWRWAVITRFVSKDKVEVLAFWDTDRLVENFTYDIFSTPCETVAKRQTFTRFDNLSHDFAEDEHILEMGAEIYAGYVYRDNNERVLGHIFLMSDHKNVDWVLTEETLHMVSIIVGNTISLSHIEQEAKEQRGLALTDKLTQLCNRLAFDNDMSQALTKAQESQENHFVLAIIDLDGMKQVNDSNGHDEGDRLLQVFARHLKSVGREQDHAYRIGGDEFAFLFRFTNLTKETLLRNRFSQVVTRVREQGFEQIGASVGFVSSDESNSDLKKLIKIADDRMYLDKQSKRS